MKTAAVLRCSESHLGELDVQIQTIQGYMLMFQVSTQPHDKAVFKNSTLPTKFMILLFCFQVLYHGSTLIQGANAPK